MISANERTLFLGHNGYTFHLIYLRRVPGPDESWLIVACAVAAGIQRRKRTPNQQRSTKSRPQIIGVICFAHKKYKTGALGAARSPHKVRNVRTARPQPRCIMPDRSMRSRSWHPAQKAHSESAEEHQKQAPNNRCHLLRTQKVQNWCARSRPIATQGAQCAHGSPAAPIHHA